MVARRGARIASRTFRRGGVRKPRGKNGRVDMGHNRRCRGVHAIVFAILRFRLLRIDLSHYLFFVVCRSRRAIFFPHFRDE